MKVLAIDPGNIESAYVLFDGQTIFEKGKINNGDLMNKLSMNAFEFNKATIEMIASYGMPVGQEVFDTCVWIGRFEHAININYSDVKLIKRKDIKLHICGSCKAKDSNIRQALIDRFEPLLTGKDRPKGILRGVSKDEWAALALAVYFIDSNF